MTRYPAMKSLQSSVKRVAFFNHKGGCGKTTFTVHTAFVAEEWKVRTILACLDRQGNSMGWVSKGDKAAKADAFYERSDYLSAVFSPLVMPDIENVDLVLADCPPEFDIALTVNPTLWVVPVHGRQGFDGFTNVMEDLIRSKAEILVVKNTVGRGGPSVKRNLEEALAKLPPAKNLTIYAEDIPDSDTIIRGEDYCDAAWGIPYGKKSNGAAALRKLCEHILRRCGFAPQKGSKVP